jgi:hypothetical protein
VLGLTPMGIRRNDERGDSDVFLCGAAVTDCLALEPQDGNDTLAALHLFPCFPGSELAFDSPRLFQYRSAVM